MVLWLLRAIFLAAAVGVAYSIISQPDSSENSIEYPWPVFLIIVLISIAVIAIDMFIEKNPGVVPLNTMPEVEALAIWKAA